MLAPIEASPKLGGEDDSDGGVTLFGLMVYSEAKCRLSGYTE